jgi:hypothetical protein
MSIKGLYPTIKPSLLLDFAKTKRLDPRITFTRASTGACYDGKTVAKAEENLFSYSQEFDNAYWPKYNATITANIVIAPDGTTTADLFTHTGLYGSFAIGAFPAGTYTLSYWAKRESGTNTLDNYIYNGTNVSVGTFSPTTTWERYTFTFTTATAIVFANIVQDRNTSGFGGVYIWGAQLEQRSSVTAYTPTTSQPVTNYIPVLQTVSANTARFDHDPVTGKSEGLLIEEQRTNLFLSSEEFVQLYWPHTRISVRTDTAIAPNGTLTADKLIENTVNDSHYLRQSIPSGLIVGAIYTASIYAKEAGRTFCALVTNDGTFRTTFFNLATGTLGTVASGHTATITDVGNGWYRCSITIILQATSIIVYPSIVAIDGSTAYQGDGYSGIYFWGAQLEAGAFPTSYIKTEGSQVTRAADAASITGTNFSSWYNQDEGTIFAEGNTPILTVPVSNGIVGLDGGSSSQRLAIYNNAGLTYFDTAYNGIPQTTVVVPQSSRVAYAIKANDTNVSFNGTIGISDTACLMPVINQLQIGDVYAGGAYKTNGTIKKIAYYPERLTNSQLENLTK